MTDKLPYSAAKRCGLIEASRDDHGVTAVIAYSAARRCGLIEAIARLISRSTASGIPQQGAAASLKHVKHQ